MNFFNFLKANRFYVLMNVLLLCLIIVEEAFWNVWADTLMTTLILIAYNLYYWFVRMRKASEALGVDEIDLELDHIIKIKLDEFDSLIDEATVAIQHLGDTSIEKYLNKDNKLTKAIREVDGRIKKYNEEERRRNWRVEGLAKFSEILRTHDINIKELSGKILSNLVEYINANQGAVFFLEKPEGQDPYLELKSTYAYNKERVREKRVEVGQGLLGQSVLEKEIIYLLAIPDRYTSITSGLGEATPANIIIVPLVLNDEVYGVIELATFKKLEDYEVEFVRQLAENIASVFASLAINERTQSLLEDSQKLATELQAQEEEMRQNMEELTATQEEMGRKQVELDGVLNAMNKNTAVAELSPEGMVLQTNDILRSIFQYTEDNFLQKSLTVFVGDREKADRIINKVRDGETASGDYETKNYTGDLVYFTASFSPIKDTHGKTIKILMLGQDITERKLQEKEFERLSLVADNTDNSVIITDADRRVEYVNSGFERMTGYTLKEMLGKNPGDVLMGSETSKATRLKIRDKLNKGQPIYEEILNYTKSKESYWISMAINPIKDASGKIVRFISIQANITETKKKSLDFKYKLEAISRSNAILELDLEGKIHHANENFLGIIKYESNEIIGKDKAVIIPEDKVHEYNKMWKRLVSGEIVSGEFEHVNQYGQRIWLKGVFNPIRDLKGKVYRIIQFANDITQEKELALNNKKHQVELDNYLNAINKTVASVEFDLTGNFISANDIFTSIMGYAPGQLETMHYMDMVPENELVKPQNQMMWDNLSDGKAFNGEFKLRNAAGKEMWLTGTLNPIFDIHDKPYKVMLYAQFNTQEKEKQKSLTGFVDALKNSAPIMELNPDGTFKSANKLFFDSFGYKRLEISKKPFIEFLSDKGASKDFELVMKKMQNHEMIEQTFSFVNAAGNMSSFRSTFNPIFDLEDKLNKIVVIMMKPEMVLKEN